MSEIAVAGAGAFGTALAIALAKDGRRVSLLGRDTQKMTTMQRDQENQDYLPGIAFPKTLSVAASPEVLGVADIVLLSVPTQSLRGFLVDHRDFLADTTCVLCCKGIEKETGLLPSQIVAQELPNSQVAVLTGPGFAVEIANGLPTALTLATTDSDPELQKKLSTQSLRLYLSGDPVGAQLGGALKNVCAIACGIAMGAGLGESARASVLTRGYAEMLRLAVDMGAEPATLSGLSGLGDLALTCTSPQSRNFSLGLALGKGGSILQGTTFEGVATARASLILAERRSIEMPLTQVVAAVLERSITISEAVDALMSRPLKSE